MKASETIWNEYHRKLAAFINSKVDSDAVDDLLQDVFMKIHTQLATLNDDTKLESWLYQITRNTITDYYRTKSKTEPIPDWIEPNQTEAEESIRTELSSCLEPMIRQLPEKYRIAIQLSEIENKTQQEVADMAGISLSGAKSRVQRGRALLKTMLLDCCRFEFNQANQVLSYEPINSDCKNC